MSEEMIHIIEDYALMEDFLLHVYDSLESKRPMPSRVPLLNNTLITDALSKICEHLSPIAVGA